MAVVTGAFIGVSPVVVTSVMAAGASGVMGACIHACLCFVSNALGLIRVLQGRNDKQSGCVMGRGGSQFIVCSWFW